MLSLPAASTENADALLLRCLDSQHTSGCWCIACLCTACMHVYTAQAVHLLLLVKQALVVDSLHAGSIADASLENPATGVVLNHSAVWLD